MSLAGVGIAGKNRIREQWYMFRLRSTDEAVKLHAAEQLGEMKSARAVENLILMVLNNGRENLLVRTSQEDRGMVMTPVAYAVYQIGDAALPLLEDSVIAATLDSSVGAVLIGFRTAIRDSRIHVERGSYADP